MLRVGSYLLVLRRRVLLSATQPPRLFHFSARKLLGRVQRRLRSSSGSVERSARSRHRGDAASPFHFARVECTRFIPTEQRKGAFLFVFSWTVLFSGVGFFLGGGGVQRRRLVGRRRSARKTAEGRRGAPLSEPRTVKRKGVWRETVHSSPVLSLSKCRFAFFKKKGSKVQSDGHEREAGAFLRRRDAPQV